VGGVAAESVTKAGSTSKLSAALNKIQAARNLIKSSSDLAVAINSDFENVVGGTLRSVALMLKEAVGAARTWADFPASIRDTAYRIINENSPIFKNLLNGSPSKVPSSAQKLVALTTDTSSIDSIPVDQLTNPTVALRAAMAKEVARVKALTTNDLTTMRTQVEMFATQYAAAVGTPDPRSTTTTTTVRAATDSDFRLMNALAEASDAISQIIITRKQQKPTSLLDYVAGLATTAGISMRRANSKFAVPFPYGSTLEQLALQYLGDATRWGEIVALNELREPFIDEVGQTQVFLANGNGNQFVIADGSLLQLDHLVQIASQTQFVEQRRVVAIEQLSANYWLITVAGDSTLSNFTLHDVAYVRYFLPATVNSSKVIFIPSENETTNADLQLRFVPTLTDLEKILQVGGVDGMLTDKGDIALSKDGDWPYVQGMATLIQWARVSLSTPIRSWLLAPAFGIDVGIGRSLAEQTAQDVLDSIRGSFKMNPAFTGIKSALVTTAGPTTQITLELGVKGVDVTLPVVFEIAQ